MDILLAFRVYVKFEETEHCNPYFLEQLKKWLTDYGFAFDIIQNPHLPKEISVREISIYCPPKSDAYLIFYLTQELEKLTLPYVEGYEPPEMPEFLAEPPPGHKEIKTLENAGEIVASRNEIIAAQTSLDFYDNWTRPEESKPGGAADPERKTKKAKMPGDGLFKSRWNTGR